MLDINKALVESNNICGTTQEWQILLTASDPLPHAAPSSAAHKASKTEIKMAKEEKSI
jgi:hypothetical protein